MEEKFMQRALELAALGKGRVDTNPLVGAVIVKDGKIIGEGYHEIYGGPHAEVNAFLHATEDVRGADMYVTLEPCSHHGKTPPCALKIIEKDIKRVFISSLDPNPLVNGKGVALLKNAGIEVKSGILDEKNQHLNRVFLKYIQTKMPYVVMKSAMTADGKTATSTYDSKWISNEKSRAYVHELRTTYMGIMVGVNTINIDDAKLNVRLHQLDVRQPVRIIVDQHLEINPDAYVIKTAHEQQTIILTSELAPKEKRTALEAKGVIIKVVPRMDHHIDLQEAMRIIGSMGINSVLLEGGSGLNFSAMQQGIIDEVVVFIAPKLVGGKHALTPIGGIGISNMSDAKQLILYDIQRFDDDMCLTYLIQKEVS